MVIEVTPDQVDNARLLLALDKARGRTSEDWLVRLANAKPATPQSMDQREAASSRDTSARPATPPHD